MEEEVSARITEFCTGALKPSLAVDQISDQLLNVVRM